MTTNSGSWKWCLLGILGIFLLGLTACADTTFPEPLAPGELRGVWKFEGVERPSCPVITLDVTEAVPAVGGHINLRGEWNREGNLQPAPIPNDGEFSGSVNRETGELDLLLWRIFTVGGWVEGELRGRVLRGRGAEGRVTWGVCPDQKGTRVQPG